MLFLFCLDEPVRGLVQLYIQSIDSVSESAMVCISEVNINADILSSGHDPFLEEPWLCTLLVKIQKSYILLYEHT